MKHTCRKLKKEAAVQSALMYEKQLLLPEGKVEETMPLQARNGEFDYAMGVKKGEKFNKGGMV
ncbi:hypothetical protein D7V86_08040 [bacterium D16-51]|nr:hypothetical protein D7V96_09225 [bacterium D16-59]RKI60780.1 hypothetical protein D7V86_08040 [bacterium D16-51]